MPNIKNWKTNCLQRLLGFQYELLSDVCTRNVKASKSAGKNIEDIKNSIFLNEIINQCSIVAEYRVNVTI